MIWIIDHSFLWDWFGNTELIWMDNVYCSGYETKLTDCHFDGWGLHDCGPSEAAGVICAVAPPSPSHHHQQQQRLRPQFSSREEYNVLPSSSTNQNQNSYSEPSSLIDIIDVKQQKQYSTPQPQPPPSPLATRRQSSTTKATTTTRPLTTRAASDLKGETGGGTTTSTSRATQAPASSYATPPSLVTVSTTKGLTRGPGGGIDNRLISPYENQVRLWFFKLWN